MSGAITIRLIEIDTRTRAMVWVFLNRLVYVTVGNKIASMRV